MTYQILEFLVDNIFVVFAPGNLPQTVRFQWVRIVPPSPDPVYTKRISYNLCSLGPETFSISVQTYRYIDDVEVHKQPSELDNYLGQMYHAELRSRNFTESTT